MSETETNLQNAIAGEANARLEYTAFAMRAMQEGHRVNGSSVYPE